MKERRSGCSLIYLPTNVYPQNVTIDAASDNVFSFIFNGDQLRYVYYNYYVADNTEGNVTANTYFPPIPIYGGDTVNIPIPANTFANGREYVWRMQLYQRDSTIFVLRGTVGAGSSGTRVVLANKPSGIVQGMTITIDGVRRTINSYVQSTGVITTGTAFSGSIVGKAYVINTHFVDTPNGYYFQTRSTPTVEISDISSDSLDSAGNLKYRSYTFTGTYTQLQNVSIRYHKWILQATDPVTHKTSVITQTDEIYNSHLTYTFDGFNSGVTYTLILEVVTQDNVVASHSLQFSVLYVEPVLKEDPLATWNPIHNSVLINAGVIKVAGADVTGTYEFIDDEWLHIKTGYIQYSQMNGRPFVLDNFTLLTEMYIDPTVATNLIGLLSGNERDYYITSLGIKRQNDGSVRRVLEVILNAIIGSTQSAIAYPVNDFKDGSRPMLQYDTPTINNQYDYLWMDNATWDLGGNQYYVWNTENVIKTNTYKICMTSEYCAIMDYQGRQYRIDFPENYDMIRVYNKLRLYAGCYYHYIMLMDSVFPDEDLAKFFTPDFEPGWDVYEDTLIMAIYKGTLVSSNIDSLQTSEISKINIYRQEVGDTRQHFVGSLSINDQYIEDFMVANNKVYQWFIVPVSDKELGAQIATNELMIKFDEYTVNPLDQFDDGTYKPLSTWKFGLNTESDNYEQNILKTKFDGLGRYPKYTVEARNYISGSLSAYLSFMSVNNIADNRIITTFFDENSYWRTRECIYLEPAEMLDEWNDMIVSGVECLIRDLKGHIWRCQIDANSFKIENFNQISPTTIDFNFTQVGSAEDTIVYDIESDFNAGV